MSKITRVVSICISLMVLLICSCAAPAASPTLPPTPTPSSIPPTAQLSSPPTKPTPVVKELELKYDDGEGNILSQTFASPYEVRQNGYLVDFTPAAKPFTIKKVKLYGTVKLCPI